MVDSGGALAARGGARVGGVGVLATSAIYVRAIGLVIDVVDMLCNSMSSPGSTGSELLMRFSAESEREVSGGAPSTVHVLGSSYGGAVATCLFRPD